MLFKKDTNIMISTKKENEKLEKVILESVKEVREWQRFIHDYSCIDGVSKATLRSIAMCGYDAFPAKEQIMLDIKERLLNEAAMRVGAVVRFGVPASFQLFFEVDNENDGLLRRISHTLVSKTRAVTRFDTPALEQLRLKILDEAVKYELRRTEYLSKWIQNFRNTYKPEVFQELGEIDRLISTGYFYKHIQTERTVRPIFSETITVLQNAFLPKSLTSKAMIGNDYSTGLMVIHGQNASGKSTYARTIATNILLAHCGLLCFAEFAEIKPVDCIGMRFGSNDSLIEGVSNFESEVKHMWTLASKATRDSFIAVDELGASTDVQSGARILEHFISKLSHVNSIFLTHFSNVAKDSQHYQMKEGYKVYEALFDTNFDSNVFEIAKECGLPLRILAA
jgi:DNA mismatch repair ATPase MutS